MNLMLSEITTVNSGGFVHNVEMLLAVAVCVAIVYGLGVWLINSFETLKSKPNIRKIWDGVFIFLGAFALINFIMSVVGGHGFIAW